MSQGALAKGLGVTAMTVSNWERDTTRPKAQDVATMAVLFGAGFQKEVTVWLLTARPKKKKRK